MEPEVIEQPAITTPAVEASPAAQPNVISSEGLAALREQIRSGQMGEGSAVPRIAPVTPEPIPAVIPKPDVPPTPDLFLSKLEELSGGSIKTSEELSAALAERNTLAGQKKQFDETVRLRELLDDPEKLVSYSRLLKTDFSDRDKVSDKEVLKAAFVRENSDLDPDTANGAFERHYAAKYPALKPEYADESDPDYKVDLGLCKRDSDLARTAMETYKEEQRLKFSAPDATADKPSAETIQKATEAHLETIKTSLASFSQYGVKFGEKGAEQTFNFEVKPELKAQLEDFMVAPYQAIEKMLTPNGPTGDIDYATMRKIGMAIFGFDTAVGAAAQAAFNRSESKVIAELSNTQPIAPNPGESTTVDDRAGFLKAAGQAGQVRYNSKL